MTPDYRSDPMETPEGAGKARKAWDAYARAVNRSITPFLAPAMKPAIDPIARQAVEDMIGFWVMWHLYGGFEGLEEFGFHKATIWRKIKRFRTATGFHPDVFTMPGISINPEAYWASADKKVGPSPKKRS
jgi:hypothetical protein